MEKKTAGLSKVTDKLTVVSEELRQERVLIETLKNENAKLRKLNDEMRDDYSSVNDMYTDMARKYDNYVHAHCEDKNYLEGELDKATRFMAETEDKLREVKEMNRVLNEKAMDKAGEIKKLKTELTKAREANKSLAENEYASQQRQEALQDDILDYESERVKLSHQVQEALRNAKNAQNELDEALKEKYRMRETFQMMMDERNEFERKNKGLLKVIDSISDLI